ncbi:MAG: uracil-DNA glycosylase [Boseongicola sp.]|nr:uracil-DNA glycosylase [Boseongicola sp.]
MTGKLGAWAELPFFTEDWPRIAEALALDTRRILPPAQLRFAALERCQPAATRAVILGQDPYPTSGHANGLAFSATSGTALPKSLRNIFRELHDDIGRSPATGDLASWADAGVLLLNTALTVPEGSAGGHLHLGWDALAAQVLRRLSDSPRAFILWGKHAQGYTAHVKGDHHLIITSAHPSPLSAHRGFFGSRPFSRVNSWLEAQGHAPIPWS